MNKNPGLDRRLIKEAAAWFVRLNSGHAGEADHRACQQWTAQSAEHARAWALAQRLAGQFDRVPSGLELDFESTDPGRRRAIKMLSVGLVVGGSGWLASLLPWRAWSATYQTATGEQRSIVLADGTSIFMNTSSAVDVNNATNDVWLRSGEILVTRPQEAARARGELAVRTRHGTMQIASGRCGIRQFPEVTRVAALVGAVQIDPSSMGLHGYVVPQGQTVTFSSAGISQPSPVSPNDQAWSEGVIYANGMRLGDFIDELKRYHRGVLFCASAVADMRISGVYQLGDVERTLALLSQTYPLAVSETTSYWIDIQPRERT